MGNSGSWESRDPPVSPKPPPPKDGAGTRDKPLAFKGQRFQLIRSQCLRDKRLFEDPLFPADESSLGSVQDMGIEWVRASKLFANPQFFVDSFNTTDIVQGRLGDCWFLAAMSSLTLNRELFTFVVPNDQNFHDLYAGIFHFRFWQFGSWVDVVIDDRLPIKYQSLIFTSSSSKNELWSALLEKAYAKLHGSYSSLRGGLVSEAMVDFTGGIAVTIKMSSTKGKSLWRLVKRALNKQTMISCSIQASKANEVEKDQGLGLVAAHAYAIVDAEKVRPAGSSVRLFRVRNPWGEKEYNGPWSDRSSLWKEVSFEEKARLKLKISEDGEFWIPADVLVENFTEVEVCNVDPLCPHTTKCVWAITNHEGMWMKGISAGGNISCGTFCRNPQFRLRLREEDEEVREGDPACTISVQLLQKHGRKRDGTKFLFIAFYIFTVPQRYEASSAPFGRKFFSEHRPVFDSGAYVNTRSVSKRMHLPPGQYVIVPCTYNQNEEREFFLRIFAKKNNVSRENGITLNTFKPKFDVDETDGDGGVSELLKEAHKLSRTLSAAEFMEIFNSAASKRYHLTLETCCSLVFAVNDPGDQGWLTRQEAENVTIQVQNLQEIFDRYAMEESGLMNSSDLRPALSRAGFLLDALLNRQLWLRHQTATGTLTFSHFISCAAKMQKLFQIFKKLNSEAGETRDVDEWLLLFVGI
ncbi:calpain-2 catalytic subunit-like [Narcine bancroftii]|uniref:calpain-2 catalytic subunit-like n=1 Tax=Narcine bancroftii TaxID=1343680 RepID=UPI003831ABE4